MRLLSSIGGTLPWVIGGSSTFFVQKKGVLATFFVQKKGGSCKVFRTEEKGLTKKKFFFFLFSFFFLCFFVFLCLFWLFL